MARHPAYGKTYEHRLAVLADGTPGPIGGSPVLRHHMLDLYRTEAGGP